MVVRLLIESSTAAYSQQYISHIQMRTPKTQVHVQKGTKYTPGVWTHTTAPYTLRSDAKYLDTQTRVHIDTQYVRTSIRLPYKKYTDAVIYSSLKYIQQIPSMTTCIYIRSIGHKRFNKSYDTIPPGGR